MLSKTLWADCKISMRSRPVGLSCSNRILSVLNHSVVSNSWWPRGLEPARLLCPWGFSRPEYWSGLPCPPPGDLPNPRIKPLSPALQVDSLPSEPLGPKVESKFSELSILPVNTFSWIRTDSAWACEEWESSPHSWAALNVPSVQFFGARAASLTSKGKWAQSLAFCFWCPPSLHLLQWESRSFAVLPPQGKDKRESPQWALLLSFPHSQINSFQNGLKLCAARAHKCWKT